MPPIFTAASFASTSRPAPVGTTGAPAGAADAVSLTLSDGSVAQIFDTLETGLKCMEFMRLNNQWLLQASDDVAVVSVSGVKLLLLEMGLVQQKMLASFCPTYVGGATRFLHRTMSQSLTLDQALQAVGFGKLTSALYRGNYDLAQSPSPHVLVVDWYFRSAVSASAEGSQLADPTPINYDYTP